MPSSFFVSWEFGEYIMHPKFIKLVKTLNLINMKTVNNRRNLFSLQKAIFINFALHWNLRRFKFETLAENERPVELLNIEYQPYNPFVPFFLFLSIFAAE